MHSVETKKNSPLPYKIQGKKHPYDPNGKLSVTPSLSPITQAAKLNAESYAETKLETKYGSFNIRVYPDKYGKETVVLWTDALDPLSPVLVRVHSECLTGDVLGSLKCDCGKQLAKSQQIIAEEGGILIYLRQEGRGIGLFEKIKCYQLQSKGYDTFEANVILGHRPDARSYEMVKTVLQDLNIEKIKLLTNNPSKVSEIAKLGIEITERVPLVSKPNKYNKEYIDTKKNKFQHLFDTSSEHHYFYQFHVDDPKQVINIAHFLKGKKKDPLLKICIGIGADHISLQDKNAIQHIESIISTILNYPEFIPILHFSFRGSSNFLETIAKIKNTWPHIKRLQLNDLNDVSLTALATAFDLFKLDIPLCNEQFPLVYKKQFRNLIRKHKAFILLDNSKGMGIKESKESLMNKIEILMNFGLNDIALCGGFGPDELETYFELRRYYRLNFSIDAETQLKSDGKIDIEKIKTYLLQLIRFDDPHFEGIEQTRNFLLQSRRPDWCKTTIKNIQFLIHPNVFHAGIFPSSAWFADIVSKCVQGQKHFCEVGCGSGVISCLVCIENPEIKTTATDINPNATENTALNAQKVGVQERLIAKCGDVLDGIEKDNKFDTIFWALPFGYLDPGASTELEEMQVFDPGYRAIRKFFKTAKKHLKIRGQILIGFSPDLGHKQLLEELAKENNVHLEKVSEINLSETQTVNFQLLRGVYN